ncbi:MAG: YgiQ family radical SAM protein [Marinilabiliales bacterium]|nr:YgiQ family radical SAM protein [Marinilabiliales bacterium]
MKDYPITEWLPTTVKEMQLLGWDRPDVVLFSGDAYVDHPSFGAAVIGRLLQREGMKVAIVPQPNWQDDLRDFRKFGEPRHFFAVTAGCMDSMVNHYTANKRKRSNDAYTPGDRPGARPDYATIVYCNLLKKLYPHVPLIIGGIEASLRRVTHYDYWSDRLRPGILVESKADLLFYGMGEKSLLSLVEKINQGHSIPEMTVIPQTAYLNPSLTVPPATREWQDFELFSHEACQSEKINYAKNFKVVEEESNRLEPNIRLVQKCGDQTIVLNPAWPPLTSEECDSFSDLPFTRLPHPRYHGKGTIPAYEMIRHSVNVHRGCFGGCGFCTISAHQGKFIASRSEKSILREVADITRMPDFKGYISDVGGPSANMYRLSGIDLQICRLCKRPSCIYPSVCKNLNTDHQPMSSLYRQVEKVSGVKKAFIGSGIRYDLIFHRNASEQINQNNEAYLEQVITRHVSGRLKVAPEHTDDKVLSIMRKPSFSQFLQLKKFFDQTNEKHGLRQQLIPYFISSHPGSDAEAMADLAARTKALNFKLEQVQDFTPTPMTLATVIYYSGYHPYTLKKISTAESAQQKLSQRRFFFWYQQENRRELIAELRRINRPDLEKLLFG